MDIIKEYNRTRVALYRDLIKQLKSNDKDLYNILKNTQDKKVKRMLLNSARRQFKTASGTPFDVINKKLNEFKKSKNIEGIRNILSRSTQKGQKENLLNDIENLLQSVSHIIGQKKIDEVIKILSAKSNLWLGKIKDIINGIFEAYKIRGYERILELVDEIINMQ